MQSQTGTGIVPQIPFLQAATKEFLEIFSSGTDAVHTLQKTNLNFSSKGCSINEFKIFLHDALNAGKKSEPTVETGNKYGVNDDFDLINSELLMFDIEKELETKLNNDHHRQRALEMYRIIFENNEMRNRNVLHGGMLDSCIIGNLLNFFKQMFGLPFGGHGTDGNEVLSLCMYSYRQKCISDVEETATMVPGRSLSTIVPLILYMNGDESKTSANDSSNKILKMKECAERLVMDFQTVFSIQELKQLLQRRKELRIACVMIDFEHRDLDIIANQCSLYDINVHIHLHDQQWRNIFIENMQPIHYDLPEGISSLSIEDGLLSSGYSVYKDIKIRDLHLDVGYEWQAAYMSPNEGGSGASMPLFKDFATIMMGWNMLQEMSKEPITSKKVDNDDQLIHHHRQSITTVSKNQLIATIILPEGITTDTYAASKTNTYNSNTFLKDSIEWGKKHINENIIKRSEIENELINFQREFVGGKDRYLETFTTGGGTRSINLAFQSVLSRVKNHPHNNNNNNNKIKTMKVLTGNPHLAVERAERRFRFQLVRLVEDGSLSLPLLKIFVQDKDVVAIYSQTLSYTDGITDKLKDILLIVENENIVRLKQKMPLITLINDCCLAFSVLCHQPSTRLFDLSKKMITPVIVTLDAHKHIGTDKGLSTVIGTKGTLSVLNNSIKVGAQPTINTLIRALACMKLIGKLKYVKQYELLGTYMNKLANVVEKDLGLNIIHAKNRMIGSTVISVEDPSGIYKKYLKKKGHILASLFNLYPEHPNKCQTGWQLSLTPYGIRKVHNKEGKCALDIFITDLIQTHSDIQKDTKYQFIRNTLKMNENSFIACIIGSGNLDPFFLPFLSYFGSARRFMEKFVRRKFTYPSN
jgi:hypothetical protein